MRIVYITWTYTDDPSLFVIRYSVNGDNSLKIISRIPGDRRYYVVHLNDGDKLHFEIQAVGPNDVDSPAVALDYTVP